jgi:class 3 adenylate cyclase
VFFADLTDSTRRIEGLDPEAAQQLRDPAIHLMMDAVHRFEGTVHPVLGDGMMALFGAPIAHEDHALRACSAALAVQHAVRTSADAVRRTHGRLRHLRVGLNAGEVVVQATGNDLHTDSSAVGPHTHLAARMAPLAAPGRILRTGSRARSGSTCGFSPRRGWRGRWPRSGLSPRAGATGRRRGASPRGKAERGHRSLPTPPSVRCPSPKGP